MSELSEAMKEYRIEEAADALIWIFFRTTKGISIPKPKLFPMIAKRAVEMRHAEGVHYIPTVTWKGRSMNVKEVTVTFVSSNWTEIVLYCARDKKKYFVPDHNHKGFFQGTLEDWTHYIETEFSTITAGMTESLNARAEIARDHGHGCKSFLFVESTE